MTSLKHRAAAVAASVLLAASLAACGDDESKGSDGSSKSGSGSPDDASQEDFCKAYTDTPDLSAIDQKDPPEDQAKALKAALTEYIGQIQEVGTPDDVPDDARKGFEATVDATRDLDVDDIAEAIEKQDAAIFDEALSADDKKNAQAFEDWATKACPTATPDAPEAPAPS